MMGENPYNVSLADTQALLDAKYVVAAKGILDGVHDLLGDMKPIAAAVAVDDHHAWQSQAKLVDARLNKAQASIGLLRAQLLSMGSRMAVAIVKAANMDFAGPFDHAEDDEPDDDEDEG